MRTATYDVPPQEVRHSAPPPVCSPVCSRSWRRTAWRCSWTRSCTTRWRTVSARWRMLTTTAAPPGCWPPPPWGTYWEQKLSGTFCQTESALPGRCSSSWTRAPSPGGSWSRGWRWRTSGSPSSSREPWLLRLRLPGMLGPRWSLLRGNTRPAGHWGRQQRSSWTARLLYRLHLHYFTSQLTKD